MNDTTFKDCDLNGADFSKIRGFNESKFVDCRVEGMLFPLCLADDDGDCGVLVKEGVHQVSDDTVVVGLKDGSFDIL